MLTTKLFESQETTVKRVVDIFEGKTGHCSNGAIICNPPGFGKTLTALEIARKVSASLRLRSNRTVEDHGPIFAITQKNIVETWLKNGSLHYDPPLKTLFLGNGESVLNDPRVKCWYYLKDYDIIVTNYEMLASTYKDVVAHRTTSIRSFLENKNVPKEEVRPLKDFLARHIENPNMNEPIPCKTLASLERVVATTNAAFAFFFHCWPVVIMDEIHESRSDDSGIYRACVQLRAKFRVGLTATPFNNKIHDIVSLFTLVAVPPPPPPPVHTSSRTSPGLLGFFKRERRCSHDFCLMLPKSAPCAMDTFGSIEIEKIDCSTHPNTDESIGGWSELARSPSNSDQFCAAFMRGRERDITQESTQSLRSHYQPVDIIAHVGFMTEEEHNAYNKTSEVSSKYRVISRVVRSIMAASSLYHEKFSPDMLEFMKEKYTVEAPSKIRALMDLLAAPINRSEKSIVFAHYVQTAVQVDALVRKTYPHGVAVFLIVS